MASKRFAAASTRANPPKRGLDQEFNSLHAQREAGEAYIASQKEAGWKALPDHYDDGGFSGGNLDRPALQRLLADIERRTTATVGRNDGSGRMATVGRRYAV